MSSNDPRPAGLLVGLFLTAVPSTVPSQEPAPDGFVVRNARVFDGSLVREALDVAVAGGRIAALGRDLSVPEGTAEIDGASRTLLPGLIDSHTHVIAPDMLEQALAFGVTTELDMFMSWELARGLRAAQAEGRNANQADLRSAGTLVTAPGGHGTEYGVPIPTLTAPEEAQAFVDARIEEGSDYIKVVYDTGESYGISFPSISKETLGAVIGAAHARQKLAVVHVSTLAAARDAVELGADGLAHVFFEALDGAESTGFTELAARRGAFVIPTLTVLESASGVPSGAAFVEDPHAAAYLSARAIGNLGLSFPARPGAKDAFTGAQAAVRRLSSAGVPILAGSDAPNPGTAHGASLHRELQLLVDAGLSPLEALKAATSTPAARFGLTDRGAVRAGLRADLLLVEGDPTTDIAASRAIVAVWKAGVRVDREAYREKCAARSAPGGGSLGAGDGLVSDFEDGEPSARFGAGWSISTDALMGGKSRAEMEVVEDGAAGSRRSMAITGEVVGGGLQTWAGVMFSPGDAPMMPADLSSKEVLSFWAKGDGKTYYVMLFLQSAGFTPVVQSFSTGPEWERHAFPFEKFNGSDGSDVMGVYFGGGRVAGELRLQIDGVRFE